MFSIVRTLVKSLFHKTSTIPHTSGAYSTHELRGHIENDIDVCIFCGMCQRKCPTDALMVDRKEKSWAIERFRCIQCGSCVESCPKKCLSMHSQRMEASTDLTKDVLYARVPTDTIDHKDG